MKDVIFIDTELAPNAFLIAGKSVSGQRFALWLHEPETRERVRRLVNGDFTFVTFNGRKFDIPILAGVIAGLEPFDLKLIADDLIENRLPWWEVGRKYDLPRLDVDHIDLIEVAPSFVSLKAYGARMNMQTLKDLPFAHDEKLPESAFAEVEQYCFNDLDTTEELYNRLKEPLALRIEMSRRYKIDLRSKSDTQMAEAIFIKELGLTRDAVPVPQSVTYNPPDFLVFKDPALNTLLQSVKGLRFDVNQLTGHVVLPNFLNQIVTFGAGTYQLGVGGLHSTHDKKVCHVIDEEWAITDIDAASFYPSIILICGLTPDRIGGKFLEHYRTIYEQRLNAKKSGDKSTAEVLKISLNGTFGKLASRYSPLYAPDLMIAITLTGQLTLLNLIEELEDEGAITLSANTDGIAVKYRRSSEEALKARVAAFSARTGFEFEFTPYRAMALKDVNNYVAVKPDRSVKSKGIYAEPGLRKNQTASVCARAFEAWLSRGTPFKETINVAPFTEFLSARTVNGGGVQGGEYLGRVVRWYQSNDPALPPITYKKNGNLVPKTTGARACMEMPAQKPADLDYGWYVRETARIARDLGCEEFLPEELIEKPVEKKRRKKAEK